MNEKTPAETSAPLRDGPRGGKLRAGNPGNRGGGRTPDEWRRRMAELASRSDVEKYLEECMKGKHGPKPFIQAYKYITEQVNGKAMQPVQLATDPDNPPTILIRKE